MSATRWSMLIFCLLVPALAAASGDAAARSPGEPEELSGRGEIPHWGYGHEDGPGRWGALSREWETCARGREQSPIDLRDSVASEEFCRVQLDMPTASLRVIRQEHVLDALDNGHTIQVNVDAGDTLTIGDHTYALLQYHFHAPSEHTVNGMHYPMEMHLVHTDDEGDIAVVGVFIREGDHNSAFDAVWTNMPTRTGTEAHIEHVRVDVDDMLPSDATGWRYHGSLTTPPCTEDVRWIVLKMPIELDFDQIDQFRKLFSGNNRPTQRLNGRTIISDCPEVR